MRAHVLKCNLHKHIGAQSSNNSSTTTTNITVCTAIFAIAINVSCPLATLARSFICVCQLGVRAARVTNAIHIHQGKFAINVAAGRKAGKQIQHIHITHTYNVFQALFEPSNLSEREKRREMGSNGSDRRTNENWKFNKPSIKS